MNQSEITKWMGGFFDGDGSLQASIKKANESRIGYTIQPRAVIEQTYISGLFDAEGCVQCTITEDSRGRVGWGANVNTKIAMASQDGLAKRLEKFGDCIGIKTSLNHYEKKDENWSDVFVWQIASIDSVERFCKEIRNDVIVKKEQVNVMLDRIIPMIRSGDHSHRRGFLELIAWRDVLNSHKGGTRGRYNLVYFEDLWGMSLEDERLPRNHPRHGCANCAEGKS